MSNETETEVNLVFPTPVQVSEIADSKTLNASLISEIDDVRKVTPNGLPNSWSCEVYTTISNNCRLHERPGFAGLVRHIEVETKKFADLLAIEQSSEFLRIADCWVNIYGRGHCGFHPAHGHIEVRTGGILPFEACSDHCRTSYSQCQAQMILAPVLKMEFEEVINLPESIRGKGGFGSTGK